MPRGNADSRTGAMIELHADAVALFASDMHLGEHDRASAAHFFRAFDRIAPAATHLFLLGDLFETWAGDDQPDETADALVARLRALADRGTALFVVRGNRDFLIDAPLPDAGDTVSFSRRSGARLLEDPSVVRLFGRRVLLAHGDALCTDDVEYQRARAVARSEAWQRGFLARPLAERLEIARQLRDTSRRVQAARALQGGEPGDVAADAVETALRAFDADALIHGHTHRPARHRHDVDGTTRERWVLSDWHAAAEGRAARGTFLRVDREGWRSLE